jgi:GNAT superfamily N-acetyltransferase
MNNALRFRKATLADAEGLSQLVNAAYRGDSSRKGWTTEADLLDGQRTDPDFLRELINHLNTAILLVEYSDGGTAPFEMIGSVQLEKKSDNGCYLGMFAVRPDRQGSGIGKIFMSEAEAWVRENWNSKWIEMTVITLRKELIAFYERRGYQFTGEIRPFHVDPRFGIQRRSGIELGVWKKTF